MELGFFLLHVAQSCHMAYGVVNQDNVYMCTGSPLPSDIKQMLETLLNANFRTSFEGTWSIFLLPLSIGYSLFALRIFLLPLPIGYSLFALRIATAIQEMQALKGLSLVDIVTCLHESLLSQTHENSSMRMFNLTDAQKIGLYGRLADIE